MAKFKFWVEVLNGAVGQAGLLERVVDIADENLDGLNEQERGYIVDAELTHWVDQHIGSGWKEVLDRG